MRGLAYSARNIVAGYPRLYLPVARRRYPGPGTECLNEATELVIDGFPRSANTFAVVAFQFAQARPVRVAHHLHAAAHIIEAARTGIPTLLVIRRPEDAVTSEVIRRADVSLARCARAYIRFHERVLPYVGMVSVATFDEVTGDLGAVTRRLNRRYGTAFGEFEPSEEALDACFKVIELREVATSPARQVIARFQSGTASREEVRAVIRAPGEVPPVLPGLDESMVPRPSEARRERKAELIQEFRGPALSRLRERADATFAAVLEARPEQGT